MTTRRISNPAAPSSARWTWLILGGLLTAAVLAAGTYLAWSVMSGSGMSQRTEHSSLASVETPETVVVEGTGANVELVGAEIGEATADLTLSWYANERPAVTDEWDRATWTVDLECRRAGIPLWFLPACGIDYAGLIPAHVDVEVSLGSGPATVRNTSGSVDLRTTSGSIDAYDVVGDLTASATSGSILGMGLASGNVAATADAGSIFLEFADAPSEVQAATASGNIEVLVPRGQSYRVLTDSAGGRVNIDVATDPDAESTIALRTTSGSVTVAYSD